MLKSKYISDNPKLYIFLPLYYTLWADGVLTPSELREINSLIEKQSWINVEEKNWLLSLLDPSKPPRPKELKSWKSAVKKLELNNLPNLFEIGKALAVHHSGQEDLEFETNLKTDFQDTELALGLLSKEAGYTFKSDHETVTTEYHKESNFDIGQMTSILDGSQHNLIKNVKRVIADPTFAYREYDTLWTIGNKSYNGLRNWQNKDMVPGHSLSTRAEKMIWRVTSPSWKL